jgi:hypothetical protein
LTERKTINRFIIQDYYEGAVKNYESIAGKRFDPKNGWSQVPENNFEAAVAYGRADAYQTLLLNW